MHAVHTLIQASLVAICALVAASGGMAQSRLFPEDMQYLGAFRLPDVGERPLTFAWGGNAMAFRPAGARTGTPDTLPGSLFVMGHDRMAYGELPDGNRIAEIAIPRPVVAEAVANLPVARVLQPLTDVAAGHFPGLDELPRTGLAYLDTGATGPALHLAWGQHFQPETEAPSHALVTPDLDDPGFTGPWFVGRGLEYANNGYLFAIPDAWAEAHLGGPALATGRFRDGGWSGMGPALFAYRPWTDAAGRPAPPGTRLEAVPLLHYRSSRETAAIEGALAGYSHADEWEGGAWAVTPAGKTAVLFAGTKATGARTWYGFVNPAGADLPCVAGDFVDQFTTCRKADGTPCPAEELTECAGHNGFRGWWSSAFEAQILFYDPADLARVAAAEIAPHAPQPYARMRLDDVLFLNPAGIEPATLGTGPQRRYRIGAAAHDPVGGRLFVLELFADSDKPVVHVWELD